MYRDTGVLCQSGIIGLAPPLAGRNYTAVIPGGQSYTSVGAAEVEPQVGVVPVRSAVIGQAVQFVAIRCGGLHVRPSWLGCERR